MSNLGWAAVFNGITQGINTGISLGNAIRERKKQDQFEESLSSAYKPMQISTEQVETNTGPNEFQKALNDQDNIIKKDDTFNNVSQSNIASSIPVDDKNTFSSQIKNNSIKQFIEDQPITVKQFNVGNKRFFDEKQAQAELAIQNSPSEVAKRVGLAIAKSDPIKAQQFTHASLQMQEQEQKLADAAYKRGAGYSLLSPDHFTKFLSDSAGDGQGGKMKFKTIYGDDSKTWGFGPVSEDGTVTPLPYQFSNDAQGMAEAGFILSRTVTPEQRLEHYRALNADKRLDNTSNRQNKLTDAQINNIDVDNKRADQQYKDKLKIDWYNAYTSRGKSEAVKSQRELKNQADILVSAIKKIDAEVTKLRSQGTYDSRSPQAVQIQNQRDEFQLKLNNLNKTGGDIVGFEDPLNNASSSHGIQG